MLLESLMRFAFARKLTKKICLWQTNSKQIISSSVSYDAILRNANLQRD